MVPAKRTAEKLDCSSTIIQPSEKLENTSTRAIQPAKHLSTTLQSAEKLQDSSTNELKSLERRNSTKNQGDDLSSSIDKYTKSSKTTKNRKMRKYRSGYRNLKNITPTMPVMNNHQRLNQHRDISRYVRHGLCLNVAPQPSRTNPKIAHKNLSMPSDRFRLIPAAGHMHMRPMQLGTSKHIESLYERMIQSRKLTHESCRYRSSHQPKVSQGFQRRNARIVSPTEGEPGYVCHFKQLNPVPFRFLPIYDKNYHSDPVIENRAPRFNARHFGVSYRTANQLWHKKQRIPKTSAVFGNEISKNRQTFDLQSNKPANMSDAAVDIGKVSVPKTESLPNTNENVLREIME